MLVVQSCPILQPHGLLPARLLCPWNYLGKNTGVGSPSLLQGIFLTQGSNSGLLPSWQILYHLSHKGSPLRANLWTKSWVPIFPVITWVCQSGFSPENRNSPLYSRNRGVCSKFEIYTITGRARETWRESHHWSGWFGATWKPLQISGYSGEFLSTVPMCIIKLSGLQSAAPYIWIPCLLTYMATSFSGELWPFSGTIFAFIL